jgi:hypothetical protein
MASIVDIDTKVVAAQRPVSSDVGGQTVILGVETGKYYSLNEIGSRIWDFLQQPRTIGEIRDLTVREYEVDAAQCEADLLALVEQLVDEKLVEVLESQR